MSDARLIQSLENIRGEGNKTKNCQCCCHHWHLFTNARHYWFEGKIPSESPAGERMYVFPLKLSLSSSPSAATEGPGRPRHSEPNAVINGVWLFCCAACLGMSGINGFGFGFASPDGWKPESLLAAGGNCGFTCNAASRCSSVTCR